jgi:hypothetical protein
MHGLPVSAMHRLHLVNRAEATVEPAAPGEAAVKPAAPEPVATVVAPTAAVHNWPRGSVSMARDDRGPGACGS